MAHKTLVDWLKQLDLFGKNQGQEDFDLESTLEHLRHLLPNQGPIKDFIHHNPLHGFQGLPFHEGVALASRLFGTKSYLGLDFYQKQSSLGSISDSQLQLAINNLPYNTPQIPTAETLKQIKKGPEEKRPLDVSSWGIRSFWRAHHQIDLAAEASPIVFKLLSSYLDQGIASWSLPSRKDSLWLSLQNLNSQSLLSLLPFDRKYVNRLLEMNPEDSLKDSLKKLTANSNLFSRYLIETVLTYPGWAGMVCALEVNPSSLRKPCSISLLDFLSVTTGVEALLLQRNSFSEPFSKAISDSIINTHSTENTPPINPARFWHDAFEWSFYEEIFRAVRYNSIGKKRTTPTPWAQAIFCIDDRECSMRRYLEQLNPGISTFGTAGFFGVDFWFLAHDELYPLQQSPVTLTPKHLVRSKPKLQVKKAPGKTFFEAILGNIFKDLFLVPFLSPSTITQLLRGIFLFRNKSAISSSLTQFESQAILEFKSSVQPQEIAQFQLGFTVDEMAERVARTLRGIGLTKNFARCVYVIAHGASSSNNPHFAAYDCGACSGKSGAPNARGFAWMANHPPVRLKLTEMGITIPNETVFFSVLHDTTQDKCLFFEEDLELKTLPQDHNKFKSVFLEALIFNAKERSRRLDLIPPELSLDSAAKKMASRAHALFEPRPELNHATNAAAIVGRRELTRGLFLDRRSFLQSYDPTQDPSGDILLGLLSAVIPVCGGINLEYFFSRIDNERFGAGTKLSHNVVGLIGVSNGVNNDLIPGLPLQMIEAHDPIRLLILIDQEPEIVKKTIERNSFLYEWVNHHWVRLATISPTSQAISFWVKDGWTSISLPERDQPPKFSLTLNEMAYHRDNLPISILNPETNTGVIG